jgi:cobalamin biosynthesis Mg chelatase CobN
MRTRDTRPLVAMLAMLTTMVFAVPSALAQSNSSIDQYIEHVPDAKGGKPTGTKGTSHGSSNSNSNSSGGSASQSGAATPPSNTGSSGNSSGSSGSASSPDKTTKKKKHKKKSKSADQGAAPAQNGDGGGTGGGDSAAKLALQHVPGADTGSSTSSDAPRLVLIALVMLAIAGVFAYLRFGRGRGRRTGDA